MVPDLKFTIDYLSDLSNLVMLISGLDSRFYRRNTDFDVADSTVEKLSEMTIEEYSRIDSKRELGDDFDDWKEKCVGNRYWPVFEWLDSRYKYYWKTRKDELRDLRDRKNEVWNQKFSDFFEKVEEVTGMEWDKEVYVNVVSDPMTGCRWDFFGKPFVYTGAYMDDKKYGFEFPKTLLHLLVEVENVPKDFFDFEGYPSRLTHEILKNVLLFKFGQLTQKSFETCIRYVSNTSNREWLLMKPVLKSFNPGKKVETMLDEIKERIDREMLENYKNIYRREQPGQKMSLECLQEYED